MVPQTHTVIIVAKLMAASYLLELFCFSRNQHSKGSGVPKTHSLSCFFSLVQACRRTI